MNHHAQRTSITFGILAHMKELSERRDRIDRSGKERS
jgi:hypothetical protein